MDQCNEDLCCPICCVQYSEGGHAPRTLSCGHTQCGNCIGAIIKTNKRCGECRTYIEINDANMLPTNYALLRVIETSKRKHEYVGLNEFKKLDDKINTFLNDLDKYKELYKSNIKVLHAKIVKEVAHKSTLEALKSKQEPYVRKVPELKEKLAKLNNLLESLQKRTEHNYKRVNVLKSKIEKVETIKRDHKMARTELWNKIKELSTYTSLAELSGMISKTEALIKDFENKFLNEAQHEFAEETLLPLFENPMEYFIRHDDNLYSSIILHVTSGKVMMKSVQSSTKPTLASNSKFINFSDINVYATGAYLCVECEGMKDTLEFQLYDNRRSQQFALLCAGVLGTNYANTSFFNYQRVGMEGENISAGAVEFKDTAQPFLNNLTLRDTEHTYIRSGDLIGIGLGDTVFQIYLEDWPSKYTDHCFGRMLTGYKFLRTNVRNGSSIKVTDCGLIFDFNKSVDLTKLTNGLIVPF